jgi:hypothetical protein
MMILHLGSSGDAVSQVQQALKTKAIYQGPVDGDYGGGTQAAVRAFQKSAGLAADGNVSDQTWNLLVGDQAPATSPISAEDLPFRCLALTGAFETGTGSPGCFCGLSGDFDDQGISFGVLQWNLGQGSLQPLLRDMISEHADLTRDLFAEHFDALNEVMKLSNDGAGRTEALEFSRSIQHPVTHQVYEPWRGYAKSLGRTREFQAIQVKYAHEAYKKALALCDEYAVWSERGAALMFDIVTQNGGIKSVTRAQILGDISTLPAGLDKHEREVRALKVVANRRAEAANPQWIDDVRRRKLCIANGEGVVHGIRFDLEAQFGISLVPRH